jgi:hypothetical protein
MSDGRSCERERLDRRGDEVDHQKRDGLRSKRIVMDVRDARSSFGPCLLVSRIEQGLSQGVAGAESSVYVGICFWPEMAVDVFHSWGVAWERFCDALLP